MPCLVRDILLHTESAGKKPHKKDLDFILCCLILFWFIVKVAPKKMGYLACIMTLIHFYWYNMSKMSFCQVSSFLLGGVSHLQQMSFILFCDNSIYCRCILGRWREDLKSVLRVDLVWDVIPHWWCSAERETSPRWERLHKSYSTGCMVFCILPKCTLHLTTALASRCFIVLLIYCCIYYIHWWNYELLNHNKQTDWMKSSDIVALINPIRFLSSSYVLLLLQLSEPWPVAEQW